MSYKKKIVILGAGGLIGSRIFEKLIINTNLQVTGVSHKKNINPQILKWNYRYLSLKILKILANTDIIINCIGENINEASMKFKNKFIIEVLLKILNKLKKKKLLIHISTCAVYGPLKKISLTENTKPQPYNLYSKTKLDGENILKENLKEQTKLIIIRSSQVIGPGFNNLPIRKLNYLIKKKIFFFISNHDAKFSYIFFQDLLLVIIKLLNKKKLNNNIYNVSNYISFKELVEENKKYLKINKKFPSINYKIARIIFLIVNFLFKLPNFLYGKTIFLNYNTFNSLTTKKIYNSQKILKFLRISNFTRLNKKNLKLLLQ
jgi:nucleoside-diphosphate-sugar epimerase